MDAEEEQQAPPALTPPPVPRLDVRKLWLTLLLPGGLTALFMGLMLVVSSMEQESVLSAGAIVVFIATISCWLGFHGCLRERYRGTSLLLLTLAYPLGQAILVFAVFFVGCLAVLSGSNFH